MEEFSVAANRPKTEWPQTVRSLQVITVSPQALVAPPPPRKDASKELRAEIDKLMRTRGTLALKGQLKDVQIIDRKISALRFKLAKPGEDYRRPAVLEISASRKAPTEQKTRLIVEPGTSSTLPASLPASLPTGPQ
jgi:hypothetical protein